MKKYLLVIGTISIGCILLLTGCTESPKTVTMTATELQNDLNMEGLGTTNVTLGYKSLQEGDTLIIQDTISNITFNSTGNKTELQFNVLTPANISSYALFFFQGNITGLYNIGDTVRITVKIKLVTYHENGITYTIDAFKEQSEQPDFQTNMYTTAMLPSVLSKV
jgi:hypothetical protein